MAEDGTRTALKGIKRNDPDPRPVEGATNRVHVAGQDPDKHYVWVSKVDDPTMNPGSYRSMGYDFVQYDPDQEQPMLGFNEQLKQGDRIESFGMILMSCSKEHKAKLDAVGQKWADGICDAIKRRDLSDGDEPMTPNERARMRGIVTKRYGGDDRSNWEF